MNEDFGFIGCKGVNAFINNEVDFWYKQKLTGFAQAL
jgi:hypothetical protein